MREPKNKTTTQKTADLAAHRAWLARAAAFAQSDPARGGSPHPTIKVGALLVSAKGKKIAVAANRFSQGLDRSRPERYENGERSLWINCAEQMVFAEAAKKRADLKGASLYVTLEPCATCAGLIVEMGIRKIFVPVGAHRRYAKLKAKWKHSIEIGLTKLNEAGVQVIAIDTEAK
jgi:tRNA(Arg) A34 adenosine deaminase TadA